MFRPPTIKIQTFSRWVRPLTASGGFHCSRSSPRRVSSIRKSIRRRRKRWEILLYLKLLEFISSLDIRIFTLKSRKEIVRQFPFIVVRCCWVDSPLTVWFSVLFSPNKSFLTPFWIYHQKLFILISYLFRYLLRLRCKLKSHRSENNNRFRLRRHRRPCHPFKTGFVKLWWEIFHEFFIYVILFLFFVIHEHIKRKWIKTQPNRKIGLIWM